MTVPAQPTGGPPAQECDYFVRCTRPAAGLVDHPVAGAVLACRRCAQEAGLPLRLPRPPGGAAGTTDAGHADELARH